MADVNDEKQPVPETHGYADISGLLAVWMVVLFTALAIDFALTGPYKGANLGAAQPYFLAFAQFILTLPGSLVLPLVVGAALGAEIGMKAHSLEVATKAGIINGIYASLVYLVAIIIIYEFLVYAQLSIAPSVPVLVIGWMALPVVVVVISAEVFAVVAHSRKINL